MTDPELLPPSVDPSKKLIGIREVRARNDATPRTVSKVRDFEVVTDEVKGTNTGPTPLETVLAAFLGCEGVIINRCAEVMKFAYSGVISSARARSTPGARAGSKASGPISRRSGSR